MISPGDTLDGRYRVLAPLSLGGLGRVFQAESLQTKKRAVIKTVPADSTADASHQQQARALFSSELESLSVLQHTGLPSLLGAGVLPRGSRCFAMEFVEGQSAEHIRAEDHPWATLPKPECNPNVPRSVRATRRNRNLRQDAASQSGSSKLPRAASCCSRLVRWCWFPLGGTGSKDGCVEGRSVGHGHRGNRRCRQSLISPLSSVAVAGSLRAQPRKRGAMLPRPFAIHRPSAPRAAQAAVVREGYLPKSERTDPCAL